MPTCPYCRMAKEYLKEKNIEFEDIDVSGNREKAREMIKKSGQMGVPVIEVDGKIIVGFDKEALDEALNFGVKAKEEIYDLIIIGACPAGLTAAIYSARKKLKTLVLSKDIGGQTIWSFNIENYIGFRLISGIELVKKFEEHVKDFGIEIKNMAEVKSIIKKDEYFEISTKDEKYHAKALIIASGKIPRKLSIPGEDKFLGKGVAYCATCDAPGFSGKDVCVVGGGNSALEAVMQLSRIANKVYLINVNPELGGDEITRDKVKSAGNVEILNNAQTLEIIGRDFMESIKIKDKITGSEKVINASGVFIEVGYSPSVDFAKGLVELNNLNEININCRSETNVPGIFAAGDVTSVPAKQIIAAAGEGCEAVLSAYEYLVRIK